MTPRPQLFIDLDNVLADFDGHHQACFGTTPGRQIPAPDDFWPRIEAHGSFFRDLPLMADARDLWAAALAIHGSPQVLTAVPDRPSAETFGRQKRAWVAAHFGPEVPVICSGPAQKHAWGQPGDILIDDWDVHQPAWEAMGGLFILHRSALGSLVHLYRLLRPFGAPAALAQRGA